MYNHISRRYHNLELFTSPSSIFGSLIADLQHARESIDMEYYIFANDRTGHMFTDLLCRKARQGVRVRLIVDGYGSMAAMRSMQRRLRSCGVEFSSHALMCRARNHRKITVIDRRVAHIGGVNIADRYVTGNGLGLWHDAQLRIEGEAVDAIVRLFDYDYMISEDVVCEVPMSYSGDGLQIIWSESRGGRAMEELLDEVVASARESLLFTTPYFMPPQSVIHRLATAVKRGVRVELIVPERCDVWLLDHVMRRHIAEAVAHGIDVRICRRAFIHSKLAIADGRRVVIGSANLDARSLRLNREVMVVTDDSGVVAAAKKFVDGLSSILCVPEAKDMRSLIPQFVCRWFENVL